MEYLCSFQQIIVDFLSSKAFLTIITSWPLMVFIIVLLLRKNIMNLVDRIKSASKEGVSFYENQKQINKDIKDIDKSVFPGDSIDGYIRKIKEFKIAETTIKEIQEESKKYGIYSNKEKYIEFLETALVDNKLSWHCELVDKNIFESQVIILLELDKTEEKQISFEQINKYFNEIKNLHLNAFSHWDVNKYLEYLRDMDLLKD